MTFQFSIMKELTENDDKFWILWQNEWKVKNPSHCKVSPSSWEIRTFSSCANTTAAVISASNFSTSYLDFSAHSNHINSRSMEAEEESWSESIFLSLIIAICFLASLNDSILDDNEWKGRINRKKPSSYESFLALSYPSHKYTQGLNLFSIYISRMIFRYRSSTLLLLLVLWWSKSQWWRKKRARDKVVKDKAFLFPSIKSEERRWRNWISYQKEDCWGRENREGEWNWIEAANKHAHSQNNFLFFVADVENINDSFFQRINDDVIEVECWMRLFLISPIVSLAEFHLYWIKCEVSRLQMCWRRRQNHKHTQSFCCPSQGFAIIVDLNLLSLAFCR